MTPLASQLTPWSRLRFWLWRTTRSQKTFTGRLSGGPILVFRPPPARDAEQAEQIFGEELFKPRRPLASPGQPAARLVDTSAGCGYAALYWATRYPDAQIIAFEPHPDRVDTFVENAEANSLWTQVLLHSREASNEEGDAKLEGEDGFASFFKKGGASRFRVQKVDFFKALGDARISLLKLHGTSPEHPLLADPRFRELPVEQVVVEGVEPASEEWYAQRLTERGFTLERAQAADGTKLLWALAP